MENCTSSNYFMPSSNNLHNNFFLIRSSCFLWDLFYYRFMNFAIKKVTNNQNNNNSQRKPSKPITLTSCHMAYKTKQRLLWKTGGLRFLLHSNFQMPERKEGRKKGKLCVFWIYIKLCKIENNFQVNCLGCLWRILQSESGLTDPVSPSSFYIHIYFYY